MASCSGTTRYRSSRRSSSASTATAVSLIGLYPFPQKNQLLIAYHVVAEGEVVLNEELAEIRLIAPERLKAWDFGTGFAVRDWLLARAV